MTTRFGVACLTLLAGMLALAGKEADPLDHSTDYSLCTSREGLLAGCSPVRMYGTDVRSLSHAGFNCYQSGICAYGFKDGKPFQTMDEGHVAKLLKHGMTWYGPPGPRSRLYVRGKRSTTASIRLLERRGMAGQLALV